MNRVIKNNKRMDKVENTVDRWFDRVCYRTWQFRQSLLAEISVVEWKIAISELSKPLQEQLNRLRKSEKAHTIRVWSEVQKMKTLDCVTRKELMQLALLHDIGKSITKPTLFSKIVKVLFSLSDNQHCIKGALFLKRQKLDKKLVIRILRHHCKNIDDDILCLFQTIDDRC